MKIYLDTIKPADYTHLYKWFSDINFLKTYDYIYPNPMTKIEVDMMINEYNKNNDSLVLVIRLDDEQPIGIAGYCDIDNDNKIATLFIGIGETQKQGKGYGKIALNKLIEYGKNNLDLFKIQLNVLEFNIKAISLYTLTGFKYEGCKEKYCLRNNERYDLLIYGKIL